MREKKEKTPKVKRIKNSEKKLNISSLAMSILALILTLGIFSGLVFLQNYLSDEIVYQTVVVAKKDIPVNLIITEDNIEEYLTVKQVNILEISKGCVTDIAAFTNLKSKIFLYAGEQVSLKDFDNLNAYLDNLKEPIEISMAIENIADAAGGKIRAGDLVNVTMRFTTQQLQSSEGINKKVYPIYEENTDPTKFVIEEDKTYLNNTETEEPESNEKETESENEEIEDTDINDTDIDDMDSEDKTMATINYLENTSTETTPSYRTSIYNFDGYAQYIYENLYVLKVLDATGVEIESTDDSANASILVFMIEKSDELEFNNALMNGSSTKVSKIIKKGETPIKTSEIKKEE